MPLPRKLLSIVVLLLALGAGLLVFMPLARVAPEPAIAPADRLPLGLMSTLPLYWPEAESPQSLLELDGASPWQRTVLERRYRLRPLDSLTGEAGLDGLRFLLLAQPRALSPAENVELDRWVRGGGRLLLFADPLLAGDSRFPLGDRRRPQAAALLSPILARWGLELMFAEDQPEGRQVRALEGISLPVEWAGYFALRPPSGGAAAECRLLADGLAARCAIGEGQALILADATLLEGAEESASLLPLAHLAFAAN